MSANLYDEVLGALRAATNSSIRCSDLSALLIALDFEIRNGGRGNHRIYTHDGIKEFYSGSFDCGHGADAVVKVSYIRKIIRTLETHEIELREYLRGGKK